LGERNKLRVEDPKENRETSIEKNGGLKQTSSHPVGSVRRPREEGGQGERNPDFENGKEAKRGTK